MAVSNHTVASLLPTRITGAFAIGLAFESQALLAAARVRSLPWLTAAAAIALLQRIMGQQDASKAATVQTASPLEC